MATNGPLFIGKKHVKRCCTSPKPRIIMRAVEQPCAKATADLHFRILFHEGSQCRNGQYLRWAVVASALVSGHDPASARKS